VKFAREVQELRAEARAAIGSKDARVLATDILLAMSEDDFRTAFKGSPMKRAKHAGLRRNPQALLAPGDGL
jgi:epoxyqueuosine reductase QueG